VSGNEQSNIPLGQSQLSPEELLAEIGFEEFIKDKDSELQQIRTTCERVLKAQGTKASRPVSVC